MNIKVGGKVDKKGVSVRVKRRKGVSVRVRKWVVTGAASRVT